MTVRSPCRYGFAVGLLTWSGESDNVPLRATGLGVGFPHAHDAEVGIAVVAELDAGGQGLELFGVAAAENNVIGDEREFKLFQAKEDVAHPFLFAEEFEAGFAQVCFDNATFV